MSWILFNRKLHKVIIQFFILLKGCNLTGVVREAKKSQISNTLTLTSCEGIANIILEKLNVHSFSSQPVHYCLYCIFREEISLFLSNRDLENVIEIVNYII